MSSRAPERGPQENNSQSTEIVPVESVTHVVTIEEGAVTQLASDISQFHKFVNSQLNEKIDFGKIPGASKPSLYKAGAEKLCRLFGFGTRIIDRKETLNMEKEFAMYTYTVEVFHLKSGKAIAQCEGSANSAEKKFLRTPIGDLLNTLSKMAQKRAFVGAVLMATGGSDFFTQDIEDIIIPTTSSPPKDEPSQAQLKALFATVRSANWSEDDLRTYMKNKFQKDSTKALTYPEYQDLMKHVKANPMIDAEVMR